MSFSYLMGIDVGVSFIKTGIYDASGKLVSMSVIENPGEYPEQGVFLQKSKKMFEITVKSIKEAVKKSGIDNISIEAIGFSGAMGGLMGVDKNWEPVAEWTIISDTRFYPYATDLISKYGKKILKYSGTNFPVFAPKILWWKAEYPEIYKNILKVMGCYGYILGKLGNLKIEEAFNIGSLSSL